MSRRGAGEGSRGAAGAEGKVARAAEGVKELAAVW